MTLGISCQNLSKTFRSESGGMVKALADVSFSVKGGEFLTVVGPSGCGKSTLLKLIAGVEEPSEGTVSFELNEADVRIGLVFQTSSIFPWRTVEKNLTYSLEVNGASRQERASEAVRLCQLVGLEPEVFLKKYPKELSGGEARRVAIGMVLAAKSNVLLFDEPTAQLDYVAKLKIGQTVQSLWLATRFTVIYVTHDIDEAILLGDEVLIMEGGRVKEQFKVALPRPRTTATLSSPAFSDLRGRILRRFEE
jgi:ABC-type nitrate/sulfonate/bicarbonate transport system ATPase subunit